MFENPGGFISSAVYGAQDSLVYRPALITLSAFQGVFLAICLGLRTKHVSMDCEVRIRHWLHQQSDRDDNKRKGERQGASSSDALPQTQSPLMRLPPELRLCIYEAVFGGQVI
ncbi:hypothetical protein VTN00DRAFT_5444 [Thermoascus crustaceus]|uniref:uncharacterized protein n=1 Tax=Thermoascus crustaceus TaxID=5088 RepID=UPI003742A41C